MNIHHLKVNKKFTTVNLVLVTLEAVEHAEVIEPNQSGRTIFLIQRPNSALAYTMATSHEGQHCYHRILSTS